MSPLLIYNISNYRNSTFLAFEIQYIWRMEYQLLEYVISANIIHIFWLWECDVSC